MADIRIEAFIYNVLIKLPFQFSFPYLATAMAERRNMRHARRNRLAVPYAQKPPLPLPTRGRKNNILGGQPYGNLPPYVRERQQVRILNPPRDTAPACDGTFIPQAVLNLNVEWVSMARLRKFIFYATFTANPPIMKVGSQESIYWRLVCERYNLPTAGHHQNVVRGIIRSIAHAGPNKPPPIVDEANVELWRDENNGMHNNFAQHIDSPRALRFEDGDEQQPPEIVEGDEQPVVQSNVVIPDAGPANAEPINRREGEFGSILFDGQPFPNDRGNRFFDVASEAEKQIMCILLGLGVPNPPPPPQITIEQILGAIPNLNPDEIEQLCHSIGVSSPPVAPTPPPMEITVQDILAAASNFNRDQKQEIRNAFEMRPHTRSSTFQFDL